MIRQAEKARFGGGARDILRLVYAQGAQHVDHHDAEGQAGQHIHGVIALKKAGEEGFGYIVALRLYRGYIHHGIDQRHDYQDRQEDQKNGGQHLADIGEDFARIEREAQHQRKEDQRENRQRQPLLLGGQQAGYRHGERHRRAARDGEEGADGQVQRAGEKVAIGAADLGAELKQAVAAADADGRHAQQRHADARDDKAGDGLPDVAAR